MLLLIIKICINSSKNTGLRIKEDLTSMMTGGVKAEIEAVASTAAALCDSYIPCKIIQADYLG